MLKASFLFALLCFALILLLFSFLPDLNQCALPGEEQIALTGRRKKKNAPAVPERCTVLPSRKEWIPVLVITLLYGIAAFWNLGSRSSPESFLCMQGKTVVLDLEPKSPGAFGTGRNASPVFPSRIAVFSGVGSGEYLLEYSDDAEGWFPLTSFSQDHVAVLKWHFLDLDLHEPVRYLRIICSGGSPWLGEIAVFDNTGSRMPVSGLPDEICDEAETVPAASDYHNSSYFDEIYHARTAWEHLNRIWPYEISHPPLGKEILSLGILLFGMTPFGWRFSGTLTGILMLPLMFLLLRLLFGKGRIPVLGTILFASGFLHFVQTRIATVDSYAVFFILLMFYWMARWLKYGKPFELAFCGIAFGLGAACKWTCLYAGAGLAILWVGHWILEFADRKSASVPGFIKNVCLCAVFFLIIPAAIYYLSYIPYGLAERVPVFSREYTKLVIDNQTFMFSYHSSIVAEHPYSSRWYQWILDIRPILYYLEYLPDGRRISIAAFVNPLICWGGLLSLPVLLYMAFRRKDSTARVLLAAYASGLLPWIFIQRLTFEYHYFASSVFLVPALCYIYALIEKQGKRYYLYSSAFTALSVLLFILFFPVLTGLKVDNDLTTRLLGWLPTWPI